MHRAHSLRRTAVVLAAAPTLAAQQTQGHLSVVGGTATDVVGLTSRAVTIAPSLTFAADPRLTFSVGASGTRFDNAQWAASGLAAAAARAPLGRFAALTLNASAAGTGTSYNISYVTADAVPAAELSAGPFTVYGGVHTALANITSDSQRIASGFPGLPRGAAGTVHASASRSVTAPFYGATARLAGDAGETMLIGYREERSTVSAVPAVDRTASLSVYNAALSLGGAFGVRDERGTQTRFGSGTLSIAMGPMASLDAAAGSYAANRLAGTPGGRFVNVGVSMHIGGGMPSLPKPEGIRAPSAGMTRLSLRDAAARRVDVAGDFSNWKPVPAQRAPNGVWFVDLRIPPGQYRYAFRVDGTEWKVPEGAAVVDDDFGGKSAWLTVSAPASQ